MPRIYYIPRTPTGTYMMHLQSKNREVAIQRLLKDVADIPHLFTWHHCEKHGYTIKEIKMA